MPLSSLSLKLAPKEVPVALKLPAVPGLPPVFLASAVY